MGSIRDFRDYLLPAKQQTIQSMSPQMCQLVQNSVNPIRAIDAWTFDMLSLGYDRRWTKFYDTAYIDATKPASVEFNFFSVGYGAGKTKQETNFEGNGMFPNPQAFVCHFPVLEIYPIPDANTDIDDQNLVLYNLYIEMIQNQKVYFECNGTDLPAGGGAFQTFGPSSAVATGILVNGIPQASAKCELFIPRVIETLQKFTFRMTMDLNAFNLMVARHPNALVAIKLGMWGEHFQRIG